MFIHTGTKDICQHFHVTAHCSKCEKLQCIAEKRNRWYMVLSKNCPSCGSYRKNDMKQHNTDFDAHKRSTLKILSSVAATGLLSSIPASAIAYESTAAGEVLDCTLIHRADGLRLHLLMHNKTKNPLTASQFSSQFVRFGSTALNMANAFEATVVIPAKDRVMVRLNIDAGLKAIPLDAPLNDKLLSVNGTNRYLAQGTFVVNFNAFFNNGIGTLDVITSTDTFA